MKITNAKEFPHPIIFEDSQTCISLYQPTHRHSSGSQEDMIRFKNLIQNIEYDLRKKYNQSKVNTLMKPLKDIEKDRLFWDNSKDGLVILLSEYQCIFYRLNRPVKEFYLVSDSFHIKPLIRVFQSTDTYHVLGVNRENFSLFLGNRYELKKASFSSDIPISMKEVLGDSYPKYDSNSENNSSTIGNWRNIDEEDEALKIYFRYIDKFILDNYSNPTGAPLVLVGLDQYQGIFRKISHNNHILDKGISSDYESLNIDTLQKEAWDIVESIYLNRTKKLINNFENKRAQFLGSTDIAECVRMGVEGRIDTILIESDRIIPGKIDTTDGSLEECENSSGSSNDILNDLAQISMKSGSHIVLLPKEKMPSNTGVAATFRY